MKRINITLVIWLLVAVGLYAENQPLRVHGHRGCAGRMPENSLEAMIHAVDLDVDALELDVQISSDSQVVVSHDAFMNSLFVRFPDGSDVSNDSLQLFFMKYDSIARFDGGSRPYDAFPLQAKMVTHIPLLAALVDSVESYSRRVHKHIEYNVEIKTSATKERYGLVPNYRTYTDLVMAVLESKKLGNRLIVQSFDARTLNYLHERFPSIRISYLIEPKDTSFSVNMSKLTFQPEIYAPHFSKMNESLLNTIHLMGMKVAVWTVDNDPDIDRMKNMGVDIIISNYPDKVLN